MSRYTLRGLIPALLALTLLGGCTDPVTQAETEDGPDAILAELPLGDGVTLPDYQELTLDNGVHLVLMERHDVPLIAFDATVKGGALADPDGREGTARITAELLEKGAGPREALEFAEAVAGVGGRMSFGADVERLRVYGEFMAKDRDLMIQLLADALQRPRLDQTEFTKLRDRSIDAIAAAKDSSPQRVLSDYAHAFLFDDHAYGRPDGGSEESLARIEIDTVRRYYRDHVGADRLVLTVVGDFQMDEMREALTDAFGGWRAAGLEAPAADEPGAHGAGRILLVDKPGASQTYFWMGTLGERAGYSGQAPLDLVNTAFGGRFTSMLNTALRIESGLSYGARSRFWQPSQRGSFAITSFTQTDTTREALDLALGVLDRLHEEALDEDTLRSVKAYRLGQFPPDFETASDLAGELSELTFYGLGRASVDGYGAAIKRTDLEKVAEVIDHHFPRRDELTLVLIGDAERVRDKLQGLGEVTEVPITDPRFDVE